MVDTKKQEKNLLRDTPKIKQYTEKKMSSFNEHKKKEVGQMSKRLIVLLAVLLAVSFSVPAFAAVQNVKVSGDLLTRGVTRDRFGLSDARSGADAYDYGAREKQAYIESIARIRIDADLTDGVSATFRTLTERYWGVETSTNTNMDLDLAYVTLNDVLSFVTQANIPLSVTLGRQELHYGNDLIIGDRDTNGLDTQVAGLVYGDLSARKSFDAIKGVLDYDPLVIDLVYAKVDENNNTRYLNDNDDVELYGVNAAYSGFENALVEGYWWLRSREPGMFGSVSVTTPIAENENTHVLGLRGTYSGMTVNNSPLMMSLETAIQFGDLIADSDIYPDIDDVYAYTEDMRYDRRAYAVQASLAYMFQDVKYTPTARFCYTYLSGQTGEGPYGTASHGKEPYSGWDPMFENQGGGTIANALFAMSNAHNFNLGVDLMLQSDLKVSVDYYLARLAKNFRNGLKSHVNGLSVGDQYVMTENKGFYQEIDAGLEYDYTEDVKMALNAGVLVPGDAFSDVGHKMQPATQLIGSMKVSF